MTSLLRDPPADPSNDAAQSIESLSVNDTSYTHTAAKFWPSLIDEVHEDYPACSCIRLSAPISDALSRRHLTPGDTLADQLAGLMDTSIEDVMNETLAELKILGPPPCVHIQLFNGRIQILSQDLPTECVDASLFPYLLVWPLEWAGIPSDNWNMKSVSGTFTAKDKKRGLAYKMSFSVSRTLMSEDLYMQSINLIPLVWRS
ncbi:MAG: hypothetical protein JXN60_05740 [Lentisphaerae bacterium]|nr:hypothetical protein [Lentisphaerota bacterium]